MTTDLLQTKKLPAMTMRELVYGKPAPKRVRLPKRLIFVAALFGMTAACVSAPRPVETETVGQLSAAAYGHIVSAPVHHDDPPGFLGVVGSADSDDAPTKVRAVVEPAEAPEVAAKGEGLKVGKVR